MEQHPHVPAKPQVLSAAVVLLVHVTGFGVELNDLHARELLLSWEQRMWDLSTRSQLCAMVKLGC